ncbi:MAG TPA: site-2 protease family protein, partial [Verrucomicrobiae bacterium]|nr:site-2 protease family protein [Verrucomicrobiae bacterium]
MHEIGHLVAARALRLNPFSVLLGHGPAVWEGFWAGVHWTFKAVPNMGLVRVWPVQRSCLRWRMLLLLGAGPATNAMVVGLAAILIWAPPDWLMRSGNKAPPFWVLVFAVNAWVFLCSMLPRHARIDGHLYPSDGLQIIALLRGLHPTVGLLDGHTRTSSTGESAQVTGMSSSSSWQHLIDSGQGEQILQGHRRLLSQRGLPRDLRLLCLDAFATCVLMMGASEHLPEALQYSEELI